MPVKSHPLADLKVVNRKSVDLKPAQRNARRHSKKQITQISASILAFGFNNPILLNDDDRVIAGHGRLAAAMELGMSEVPTITLSHMSPEEVRAYALADNRLGELSDFDPDELAFELQELGKLDLTFSLEVTGFDGALLDRLLDSPAPAQDVADEAPELEGPVVSRPGDFWTMGAHRVVCGDARDPGAFAALMAGEKARMMFTDPPFNVPMDGHIGRRRANKRRPFAMASGEMSEAQFTAFLTETLGAAAEVLTNGAIAYVAMDWRHIGDLMAAGKAVFTEHKNTIVWVKENAGLGQFYRGQHEFFGVFKSGDAPHVNTFGLGKTGRYRTNVWTYPGPTSFSPHRSTDLDMHPTVKPVAMVADAIKDVSRRGDVVLDPFGGSGTTVIAAEKTGRRARLLEIDPDYVDVICRRWEAYSGQPAMLAETDETFTQVQSRRGEGA